MEYLRRSYPSEGYIPLAHGPRFLDIVSKISSPAFGEFAILSGVLVILDPIIVHIVNIMDAI